MFDQLRVPWATIHVRPEKITFVIRKNHFTGDETDFQSPPYTVCLVILRLSPSRLLAHGNIRYLRCDCVIPEYRMTRKCARGKV